jgi:hemoglobin/transferrin/lactoferrin receptor protein
MGLLHTRKTWLLACVAIIAAHGAAAQDATTGTTSDTDKKKGRVTLLERLVVGAGKEKVAIDTPQAVTVLDQDDLDKKQATTIGDFFKSVPGVTIVGSDRVAGQAFNIRGIGALEAADESKILINIDGVNKFYEQYRMGSLFTEPELYKQVEVLRGPASSTLYGSGALGGTVNFTTKDASDFLEPGQTTAVRTKTSYDSNGNGLLGSVTWAQRMGENTEFLFSGNYRQSDKISTASGKTISGSDFNSWSGLAKVTHHFADDNEQVIRLSYQQWQSNLNDTDYSQTGTLTFGTIDRDTSDKTFNFSYENPASDNPWLDLKFSFAYSDTSVEQKDAKLPASIASLASNALFLPSKYAYRTFSSRLENTIETSGENFTNHLTGGIQLSHQTRVGETTTTSSAISFHPQGTDTRMGLYVQDEFVWADKLTIIPGLRSDFVWQAPDSRITGARNVDDIALSPKIAALYDVTDNVSVFGSIAHTERMPTLDELYSWSAATTSGSYRGGRSASLTLEKEKSNNYEIGFALSGDDLVQGGDSGQLKFTAFHNNLTNMISTNPLTTSTSAVPYYVNIGKALIRGIEVEAAYDSDYVFGNAAWSMMVGTDLVNHKALTTIPANSVSATIGGRVPEHNLEFGWNAFFAAPIITGATTGPFKAYQLHGVFVAWKPDEGMLKGLELRAGVDNLFNQPYQNNLSGDAGKGRTFKVSLAKLSGW